MTKLQALLDESAPTGSPHHFALPLLEITEGPQRQLISQTPAILLYLSQQTPHLSNSQTEAKSATATATASTTTHIHTHQVLLTVLDLSNEVHDTHHPIGAGLYYEDQKPEAARRARDLREERLPKFLTYFDQLLTNLEGRVAIKGQTTVADLALWQVLEGLNFAFPKWSKRAREAGQYAKVWEFQRSVGEEDRIKAYVESGRRKPFSDGLFRHYPELDAAEGEGEGETKKRRVE